jgi:hypothetical protein
MNSTVSRRAAMAGAATLLPSVGGAAGTAAPQDERLIAICNRMLAIRTGDVPRATVRPGDFRALEAEFAATPAVTAAGRAAKAKVMVDQYIDFEEQEDGSSRPYDTCAPLHSLLMDVIRENSSRSGR